MPLSHINHFPRINPSYSFVLSSVIRYDREMSGSTVCAAILLIVTVANLSSAGIIHANQTVCLEISGKLADTRKPITCSDTTIEQFQRKLLGHLNDHIETVAADSSCQFQLKNSTICKADSITFRLLLVCVGGAPIGYLAMNVEKQKEEIEKIMERRTSEMFRASGVTIIVRLFRESDRRIPPKATCSDECSETLQGSIVLCDCPFIPVLKPSCNIPAVLVKITKVKSISGSSCGQVNPSAYDLDLSLLYGLQSYPNGDPNPLQFQIDTNSIESSSQCTTVNGQAQLNTVTSLVVQVTTPQCSSDLSCINRFNTRQLDVTKQFFDNNLPFLVNSGFEVNVTLWCGKETVMSADNCCAPGCDVCDTSEPFNVLLAVGFNVSQLSQATCSELDFSDINTTMLRELITGASLVRQAGGKLRICGYPTVNCSETVRVRVRLELCDASSGIEIPVISSTTSFDIGGVVSSVVAKILLILTVAPNVVVNSEPQLVALIEESISGLIRGAQGSVGGGRNIMSKEFSVEIVNATTECVIKCPVGFFMNNGNCQLCPIGQYTNRAGQSACLHCPDDQTTNYEGATSMNQCVDIRKPCSKGHYSSDGLTPCDPCSVGYYQAKTGQILCVKCPTGYETERNGSTDQFDCSVLVTTPPPAPTTVTYPPVRITDNYFTSPNYPKDYSVNEHRTYQLKCLNASYSVGLFVLDVSLAASDSLILANTTYKKTYDVSSNVEIPEPLMFFSQSITVSFTSDNKDTSRGFRIVQSCFITRFAPFLRTLAFDCAVRKYIKGKDNIIVKLLKIMNGESDIQIIATDPDLAPFYQAYTSGGKPCQ